MNIPQPNKQRCDACFLLNNGKITETDNNNPKWFRSFGVYPGSPNPGGSSAVITDVNSPARTVLLMDICPDCAKSMTLEMMASLTEVKLQALTKRAPSQT